MDNHQAMIVSRWLYANIDALANSTTKGKALAVIDAIFTARLTSSSHNLSYGLGLIEP
ncbi:hypothetical protein [Levilactobacillus sp. N40-8-2]|uniref:hypothetical protein n=1 Tax=Levilactobacillus muriae TaxID=3238987 RepID=UPI0038B2FB81